MTSQAAAPATERTAAALADRLSGAGLGTLEIMSVYLGDRLGLYRALRDARPSTPAELDDLELDTLRFYRLAG
jgi:hypothetical protein